MFCITYPVINVSKFTLSPSPESSGINFRPAVNIEDVDDERGGAGGGEEKSDASQNLTPQDPKLTTLTVPVTPSGGRQR